MSNLQRNKNNRWLKLFIFMRKRYLQLNLSDADLRDANLSDANLSDADLRDANLSDANLSGANLSGANLSDAYLSGAYLSDADLRDANLSDANLSDANLRDANLSGANLRGANLRGANLRGAECIMSVYLPNMSSRGDYLYAIQHDTTIMIKAGCYWNTLAEFKARIKLEKGEDSAYMDAVEFIEKSAKRLEWSI